MNKLDRFEGFFQHIMEDSVGRLFRTPVQPAEIGRRLERAMESNQVVSVDGVIVPNDYRVVMHPQDMVIFADFVPALCRQMEQWLSDVAAEREYGFIDRVRVQIYADANVGRRSIYVEGSIVEFPEWDREQQDEIQRTEVMRVIQETGNVPPKLLMFVEGPHSGDSVIIRRASLGIGRALDNDVVVDSAEVSRHHARIEYRDGRYWIVDLQSTNGTAVNGELGSEHPIEHGDRITLGNVTMQFLPYQASATAQSTSAG